MLKFIRTSLSWDKTFPESRDVSLLLPPREEAPTRPLQGLTLLLPRSRFRPYGLFSSSSLRPTPTQPGAVGVKTRWLHLPPSHPPTPPSLFCHINAVSSEKPESSMENILGSRISGLACEKEGGYPNGPVPVQFTRLPLLPQNTLPRRGPTPSCWHAAWLL